MGEATYYLKARFKSEQALTALMPEIRTFIEQGIRAEGFWRENRGKSPEVFWPLFKEQFPQVTEYLGDLVGGDCHGSVAGLLEFGQPDDLNGLLQSGAVLLYNAYVWHLADWDRFEAYLKKKFGAINVASLSDEYVEYYDLLHV